MKVKVNENQFNLTLESLTLSELIEIIEQAFPQYKERIISNNTLQNNFAIFVNNQDARYKDRLKTKIMNADEVKFIELTDGNVSNCIDIRDLSCPTPRHAIKSELLQMNSGDKFLIISNLEHEFSIEKFAKENGVRVIKEEVSEPIVRYFAEKA